MLLYVLVTLVTAIVIAGTMNLFVISVGRKNFTTIDEIKGDYDCAIVFGAKVWSDGVVSYMLRDRLDFAYELYINGIVGKILVSGDHGKDNYDEVNAMRDYLIKKGIHIEDVFMDHAGFDTYSTIYRAIEIFKVKSAVICTQRYHLYRASYIAERMGIYIKAIPSDVYISLRLPYYKLRETAARVKAVLQVEILKTKPILGDAIPISGDGRLIENGKT